MSEQNYKFYLAEASWSEENECFEVSSTKRDIEAYSTWNTTDGTKIRYSKCTGLEDLGKIRNYTETFADSHRVSLYQPTADLIAPNNVQITDIPLREQTKVQLTLFFIGKNRREVFNDFCNYLTSTRYHAYWDTARNKMVVFYIEEEIKPTEDKFLGGTKYIEQTFTLTNVYGMTFNV